MTKMDEFEALVQAQKDKIANPKAPSAPDEIPGWYDYWEYGCVDDTFIVSTVPDQTKKTSESGIIFATEADVIQDRPFRGTVVSVGPKAKYKIGEYLFFQPTSGMDLAFLKPTKEGEMFVLLHTDAIIGRLVKDTRDTRTKKD